MKKKKEANKRGLQRGARVNKRANLCDIHLFFSPLRCAVLLALTVTLVKVLQI